MMEQEERVSQFDTMIAVYAAGWQGTKVRGLLWFSLALCLGCLKWGYDLSQTYGLSPGDGGVLRPLVERLAWGGFVALLGLSFFIGMLVYTHIYINHVWFDEAAQQVVFGMIRLWGRAHFSVPPQDIIGSRYHAGQFYTVDHSVKTPFYFVQLRGRHLPLILDGQGQMLEPGLVVSLLNL